MNIGLVIEYRRQLFIILIYIYYPFLCMVIFSHFVTQKYNGTRVIKRGSVSHLNIRLENHTIWAGISRFVPWKEV